MQLDALRWEANARNPSYLVLGQALEQAEQRLFQAAGKDPQPTQLQVEYVTASRQEETRRQRELLKLEQKTRQRQRFVIWAVAIGLVVALVLGIIAWFQRNQFLEQRNTAVARQLASQSTLNVSEQFDRALLLAVESTHTADTSEGRASVLLANPSLRRYLYSDSLETFQSLEVSPDGKMIVAGGSDNTIVRWDAVSGQQIDEPLERAEILDPDAVVHPGWQETDLAGCIRRHSVLGYEHLDIHAAGVH